MTTGTTGRTGKLFKTYFFVVAASSFLPVNTLGKKSSAAHNHADGNSSAFIPVKLFHADSKLANEKLSAFSYKLLVEAFAPFSRFFL